MNKFKNFLVKLFCSHKIWIPLSPQSITPVLGKYWVCITCGKTEFVFSGEGRKYCSYQNSPNK